MNITNDLITEFSVEQLKRFFSGKLKKFKPITENYDFMFDGKEEILSKFTDITKIGEAELKNADDLLVITAKTLAPLTNRSGKKIQYNIAKNILKEENNDAAFFIFYDENGNFRFSFIRANFLGTKRDFTSFKRYTYFVSKEQTNKTFISQISKADFKDLDSIQDAFSVEPLTKQFYEKLQRWYFWAITEVEFPEDAEDEKNGREIAVIRLITRLMFIWFMKVRDLIPPKLFDEENIRKILKDISAEEPTYYKAILQNLFFATLNTKQNERKFRTEIRGAKGFNPDYGNHNVFRYHNLFNDSESLENIFSKIPFLNGGLFECLDYKSKEKDERKYIDGFTATKGKQPIVPNFLFFSELQKKDISKFYGKKNKTYEVEGLINLLQSYNFTIDENEADDIEVALDPELLGSVFENLLASYNPETATTARKATGSFYTPREIVNYMTNESLKQYFLTHLEKDDKLEDQLDSLIKSQNNENPFDETTSKQITKLIDNLRIVDPAVGSGAFPMAMLNKLVFILGKLDPQNKHWKQSQIESVKKSVTDSVVQRKLIEQIERQFKEKNADYGRKLYLIEKCIFGVDIQQIAVEIAKLRFFISLLVDEKIDWNDPENNYGIEPLPNLDFKLMQGNSLISTYAGIDFNNNEKEEIKRSLEEKKMQLKETKSNQIEAESKFLKILNTENREDNELQRELKKLDKKIYKLESKIKKLEEKKNSYVSKEHKKLIEDFEELKHQHQNEADNKTKKDLRTEIDKALIEIFEEKIKEHLPELKEIKEKSKNIPKEKQRNKYLSEEKKKFNKKLGFDIEQIEKDLIAYTEGRKDKGFFLWNIYFAEVFSKKDGFDIVIGNPPYGNILKTKEKEKIKATYLHSTNRDISSPFLEKGTNLLKQNGNLIYIITYAITFNKAFSQNRNHLYKNFENIYLSLFDRDRCRIFKSMTQSVSILRCFNKNNSEYNGFFTSRLHRETPEITKIKYNKANNFLLSDNGIIDRYSIKHRLPKIGEDINKNILDCLLKFEQNMGSLTCNDSNKSKEIWIRTSGNYWYNAFNKKPYPSSEIKQISIKEKFSDIFILIMNSSLFYFWFRIFGDGRHMNSDILNNLPIPEYNQIKKYSLLIKKIYVRFMDKLFSVFDENGHRFNTSKIKGEIDLIDLIIGRFLYNFNLNQISHIINYDREIRQGNKLPLYLNNKIEKIMRLKKATEDTTAEEQKIDIMVYKLYELTYEEVKIVEPEFALNKKEYVNYEW